MARLGVKIKVNYYFQKFMGKIKLGVNTSNIYRLRSQPHS